MVLGVPCNQFGAQEPGSDDEILAFVTENYGEPFQMLSKVDVNGDDAAPLYQLLLANRIQAMIIEPFDYPAIESASIRDKTEILEFGDAPVPHGLIMSKAALPAAQQLKWRALIEAMRQDGTMLRIFEKYFKPDLAKAIVQF